MKQTEKRLSAAKADELLLSFAEKEADMAMRNSENGRGNTILVKTFEDTSHNEISAEYNLPDYLPDINRLLKVSAKITDISKFLSGDTLEYDGKLKCTLLYATGDGNLRSAEFERDFSGNTGVSGTSGDCDIRFKSEIETVSCRLQNPRKLTAKIKLALKSAVYCNVITTPNIVGKLTAEEERALQYRTHSAIGVVLKKAEELATPISEDLELDAALPSIDEIIAAELEPYITEFRTSDGKTAYKGEIATEILYRAVKEENETDTETAMKFSSFCAKIPISGEIPTENIGEHPVIKADVQIGNLEFRPQQNAFGENRTAELDFDYSVYLEIFCNEETEITTDMYSTEYESSCDEESLSYETALCAKSFNFSADGNAEREDADFDRIVMTTATANIEKTEKQGNKLLFSGNANVCVILTNGEGIYLSRNFTLPLRAETEAPRTGCSCTVEPEAKVLSAMARLDGERIQTNLEVLVSYTILEQHTEPRIRQISVYKDRPARSEKSPSLTLCYPAFEDTLWDIAKKYSTTVPELMSANSISAENMPNVLVIPRRRETGSKQRIL
ncbi:MAG: DUF3794 domain-containing protein [Clostridia bacterium]|nr:DUF3794 domain-containing protein [Clostridia bacterium]